MAQRRYIEPIQYEIGKDIPQAQYDLALQNIADWFAESRTTKEPVALARQLLQECLRGVTKDGQKWFGAATVSLASRIRIKCRYDIEKMEPLRTGSEKTRKKKEKEKERQRLKREDKLIPDELRRDLRSGVDYGDDPHVLLSSKEEQRWNELRASYVKQFPELATVNAEAELHLLCDLHVLTERHRLAVLQGKRMDSADMRSVVEQVQGLKRALGIHPDQLAKRVRDKEDTSISAAAARLEAMGNYRELRERFWVEELIQLWQQFMTPTADGLGYQLDEVGLFGLTRSKPCKCPKCGQRVFAGLSIEEIEAYLVKKGVVRLISEGGRPAEPVPSNLADGTRGVAATDGGEVPATDRTGESALPTEAL